MLRVCAAGRRGTRALLQLHAWTGYSLCSSRAQTYPHLVQASYPSQGPRVRSGSMEMCCAGEVSRALMDIRLPGAYS